MSESSDGAEAHLSHFISFTLYRLYAQTQTGASGVRGRHTERQLLVSRVKALAEALEGSDVSEIDLTEGGTRILIKRQLGGEVIAAAPVTRTRTMRTGRPRQGRRESVSATNPAPDPGVAIVAPLTGVFYGSPSPTSASFVQIGDSVQPGQVVCIVEAMKVFNEIKSEVSGTVTAIPAKSGQLVQKGDALIRVKPI